jgi:hypothetical protein
VVRYKIVLPPESVAARIRVEALYRSVDPSYVPSERIRDLRSATAAVRMAVAEVSLNPAK